MTRLCSNELSEIAPAPFITGLFFSAIPDNSLFFIGTFFNKPYITRHSVKKVPIKNKAKMP